MVRKEKADVRSDKMKLSDMMSEMNLEQAKTEKDRFGQQDEENRRQMAEFQSALRGRQDTVNEEDENLVNDDEFDNYFEQNLLKDAQGILEEAQNASRLEEKKTVEFVDALKRVEKEVSNSNS